MSFPYKEYSASRKSYFYHLSDTLLREPASLKCRVVVVVVAAVLVVVEVLVMIQFI